MNWPMGCCTDPTHWPWLHVLHVTCRLDPVPCALCIAHGRKGKGSWARAACCTPWSGSAHWLQGQLGSDHAGAKSQGQSSEVLHTPHAGPSSPVLHAVHKVPGFAVHTGASMWRVLDPVLHATQWVHGTGCTQHPRLISCADCSVGFSLCTMSSACPLLALNVLWSQSQSNP